MSCLLQSYATYLKERQRRGACNTRSFVICVATTLTNIYSTERGREAKILTECIENFKEGWELKILEEKKVFGVSFSACFC